MVDGIRNQFYLKEIAPANNFASAALSDTVDLSPKAVGLYVGGGGIVRCIPDVSGSASVNFNAVASGTFMPIAVKRVKASGTTATNIIALY